MITTLTKSSVFLGALIFSGIVFSDCIDESQTYESFTSIRFTLDDGVVFDEQTNLTWQRCSAGFEWDNQEGCIGRLRAMPLRYAKEYAEKAGDNWRLPTAEELYSLLENYSDPSQKSNPQCIRPYINTRVFPKIKSTGEGAAYWSSTKVEELPGLFYYIDFINGSVDGHSEGFPLLRS